VVLDQFLILYWFYGFDAPFRRFGEFFPLIAILFARSCHLPYPISSLPPSPFFNDFTPEESRALEGTAALAGPGMVPRLLWRRGVLSFRIVFFSYTLKDLFPTLLRRERDIRKS